MVSPLQDLSNRIASNTLTAQQQSVLTTALGVIIPFFPGIDDTSVSVPIQADEPLSREWIATLYTLQALGSSGGGPAVLPTNQIAWYIDPVAGNDANNGATPGTALKTAAALGALWRGVSGGGRPVLSPATGTTITVNLLNDLPTTDPLSVLLDVDIANSAALIFAGGLHAPTQTGTLATVSAFARTAAAGQVRITDAGVADYSIFVGLASLFIDTVTGAVAWLYGPSSANATGLLSPPYAPQPVGSVTFAAAPTLSAAGHAYTLFGCIKASVGAGFTTRSYPALSAGGLQAQVFFYRLRLTQPNTSSLVQLSSPLVTQTFTECQTDESIEVLAGGVNFINCFGFNASYTALGGTAVVEAVFGGAVTGTMQAFQGGSVLVDGDALVYSTLPYSVIGGLLEIGNAGYFTNAGSSPALEVDGGVANVTRLFQTTSIFYGVDGGTGVLVNGAKGSFGLVLYRNDGGGTPAASQFQLTHPTFKLGDMTSPFGVTIATAAYVGPTTGTMAHLDAALAAGTGFGGLAVDNATLSTMRLAA